VLDIFAHSTRGGGEGGEGGGGEGGEGGGGGGGGGEGGGGAFDAAVRAAADAAAEEPWVTRWQGSALSAEVEGLPANGVALMRVRARGASGAGGWSDVLRVHTRALAFGAPEAPRAEVARPLLRTSVRLRWATPRRPRSVAPMLFHRVRCSLLSMPTYSPPHPPPSPPPPPPSPPSAPPPPSGPPPKPTPTPTPTPKPTAAGSLPSATLPPTPQWAAAAATATAAAAAAATADSAAAASAADSAAADAASAAAAAVEAQTGAPPDIRFTADLRSEQLVRRLQRGGAAGAAAGGAAGGAAGADLGADLRLLQTSAQSAPQTAAPQHGTWTWTPGPGPGPEPPDLDPPWERRGGSFRPPRGALRPETGAAPEEAAAWQGLGGGMFGGGLGRFAGGGDGGGGGGGGGGGSDPGSPPRQWVPSWGAAPLPWYMGTPAAQPQPAPVAGPPLPRGSQGRTVYTGVAEQATLTHLLAGAEYACSVTVINVAGESEPSPAVYLALEP
jgi:hypothetical protein